METPNMNDTSFNFSADRWQDIFFRSVCVIVGLVSVFGNTMTIVAIQKCQKLQTIPNKFILNLAVADLVMVSQIILKVIVSSAVRSVPICVLTSVVWDMSTFVSISSLVLVAGDRFIYIYRPLHYPLLITPNRANIVIASTWLLGVTFCSLDVIWSFATGATIECGFLGEPPIWYRALTFVICALLVILLFTLYTLLIRIVLKQRRIIAIQLGATDEKRPADYKFLKMILPVALFTKLCWAPYISLTALDIFGWPQYYHAASRYIGFAFYLNSAVNFFIYAARNKDFLNTYKSLLYMKTYELKHFPKTNSTSC